MRVQTAFGRLFIGLMIALLDLRIGGFDIAPDALGYIFVVLALGKLSEQSDYFRLAKVMAFVVMVFSLVDFVQFPKYEVVGTVSTPENIMFWILTLAGGVARLLMVYFTLEGVKEVIAPLNSTLAATVESRKWYYAGFNYLWLLILPFSLNLENYITGPLTTLFVLVMLFLEILFIQIIYRVGKEFDKLDKSNLNEA